MEKKAMYECLFIVDSTLGEEGINAVVTKFTGLIEANATADSMNVNEWGNRRLAYPINDLTEGYYVLVKFESAPAFPKELDRIFNITDGLLRSLITRVEA
ncbi:MAG: 30S ribosomal protein S6 [Clostridia bacterium]|nr:30S ribosomal protein S6 [Clostridia bacterium]